MYIDRIYTKLYSNKDWNGLNALINEMRSFTRKTTKHDKILREHGKSELADALKDYRHIAAQKLVDKHKNYKGSPDDPFRAYDIDKMIDDARMEALEEVNDKNTEGNHPPVKTSHITDNDPDYYGWGSRKSLREYHDIPSYSKGEFINGKQVFWPSKVADASKFFKENEQYFRDKVAEGNKKADEDLKYWENREKELNENTEKAIQNVADQRSLWNKLMDKYSDKDAQKLSEIRDQANKDHWYILDSKLRTNSNRPKISDYAKRYK